MRPFEDFVSRHRLVPYRLMSPPRDDIETLKEASQVFRVAYDSLQAAFRDSTAEGKGLEAVLCQTLMGGLMAAAMKAYSTQGSRGVAGAVLTYLECQRMSVPANVGDALKNISDALMKAKEANCQ